VKKIVAVRPLEGFRLWLSFADGIEGVADLSDLAGRGIFSLWNDPEMFAQVAIDDSGAIVWADKIDLCPDALYLRVTKKTPEDVFPSLRDAVIHA
jgi:hypothetical protein